MTERKPRLILVDGSGYIYRAFFALPPLTRPDGTPVNAVFGFTNMLWKLLQEHPDEPIVVVFDAGKRSFRNDIYEAYKANREEAPRELVAQFPLVREAARAFGLPVVELEGYEADDVIASFARAAREKGEEVLIVSSDKDLMQLLGPGIEMWDPLKQKPIDRAAVIERYGVPPERLRDLLALTGDSSDNVPGVPGIGPKTAAQLLERFGSLEALLGNLDRIEQPKRREALARHAADARLSYRLVGLEDRVPLPFSVEETRRRPFDPETLLAFCRANGFRSLVGRIEELAEAAEAERRKARAQASERRRIAITSLPALEAVLERAREVGRLAIDTETTSLDVMKAELVGLALAVDPERAFYVPLAHRDAFGARLPGQLEAEAVFARLRPVLEDPSVLKIGHNIKYDLTVLARAGCPRVAPFDDTMLISYVLDGGRHGHGLDELAKRWLDHDTIPYEAVCGKGAQQIGFERVSIERATEYAAEDAEVTLRLWLAMRPRLFEERLLTLYERIERPLPPIIAAMERAGVKVDGARLRALSSEFGQEMQDLEARAVRLAGRPFNLGSPKQLGEVLFEELGLGGPGRKTKTGAYATSAEVLEELAAQGHELPRVILEWRQLQKLTRTYTDALLEQIDPKTGRVHTAYMLAATNTGRLSSSEPNLQNIPIRTPEGRRIREAFVAEPGHLLVSADYSQIELRILAHIADIEPLKRAFAENLDIHALTASQMFKVPIAQVGPELRRSAKTINYGIVYGIGAYGLSQRLGIPQAEAKAYIDRYFEQYPGIRDYMERAKTQAREKGYVTTLFGRRCWIPDINSRLPSRRGYAERQAINAPIQGTAADIMKRAMIRVFRALERTGSKARMLLQVHDELLFEVPEAEVPALSALVKRVMEGAAQLSVPLVVETGVGKNWGEAH
ncbi:MAG: DNA polymerase I [Geminicoccaceae bacterium]|nr:DNA polymerase I [Geminicoccaceae bacterium]MDW8125526.1 DNA polymerase I [Geminicoccaceae bacterium]MDW8341326.1 DNA polymerase I [Geminicoccaceae bacterium]